MYASSSTFHCNLFSGWVKAVRSQFHYVAAVNQMGGMIRAPHCSQHNQPSQIHQWARKSFLGNINEKRQNKRIMKKMLIITGSASDKLFSEKVLYGGLCCILFLFFYPTSPRGIGYMSLYVYMYVCMEVFNLCEPKNGFRLWFFDT